MKKPDCYKCKWKRETPGTTHIRCEHPKLIKENSNPLGQLLGILGNARGFSIGFNKNNPIGVKGDPHGIMNGWFNFPYDFDPVWLLECNGFEPK